MATQIEIAGIAGISQPYLSDIIQGKKTPTWKTVKRIGAATSTSPILWLEGTPEQRRAAVRAAASGRDFEQETHGDPASIFEPRCCEHCAEGVNHEDQSSAATT